MRILLSAGVMLITLLMGCQSTPHDANALPGGVYLPTDFSLQVHVVGKDEAAQPLEQTAQYILDPARQLRIATGPGATEDYFPGVTRVISADQYANLILFVEQSHLLAEPTSPMASEAATQPSERSTAGVKEKSATAAGTVPIFYQVWIHADGQSHRYMTTPQESPPTTQLLQMLNELRGSTTTAQAFTAGKAEETSHNKKQRGKQSK